MEIERTFRSRAETARDPTHCRSFTFSSYGAIDRSMPAVLRSSPERRRAAIGSWLASLPRPLALFAANDLWGSELVQAARERGLRVPADLAILGVDNEELLCEISHPPLSSIRIGSEQIGRTAVAVLERLLQGKSAAPDIPRVAPVEVIIRQSTDVLAVEDPDVAAALQHIRQHAVDGLSVKQLLEAVPVNRRTLERRFIRRGGTYSTGRDSPLAHRARQGAFANRAAGLRCRCSFRLCDSGVSGDAISACHGINSHRLSTPIRPAQPVGTTPDDADRLRRFGVVAKLKRVFAYMEDRFRWYVVESFQVGGT